MYQYSAGMNWTLSLHSAYENQLTHSRLILNCQKWHINYIMDKILATSFFLLLKPSAVFCPFSNLYTILYWKRTSWLASLVPSRSTHRGKGASGSYWHKTWSWRRHIRSIRTSHPVCESYGPRLPKSADNGCTWRWLAVLQSYWRSRFRDLGPRTVSIVTRPHFHVMSGWGPGTESIDWHVVGQMLFWTRSLCL